MAMYRLRGFNVPLVRRWSSLPDYSEKPEYPPILDQSRDAIRRRKEVTRSNEFKVIETVEEKVIKVNMPRYYGWRSVILREGYVPYESLGFAQYVTRTHFIDQPELPEYYSPLQTDEYISTMMESIEKQLENVYAFELQRSRDKSDKLEGNKTECSSGEKNLMSQINRVLLGCLSPSYSHLQECQVDYGPRVESSWQVGGFHPCPNLQKSRKNMGLQDRIDDPVDHFLQYLGSPLLQLRHELPLQPIVGREASCDFTSSVPVVQYDPRTFRVRMNNRHLTNIPGFWPGDSGEFGLVSFHTCSGWENHPFDDINDVPHVQAILASFGWLNALSCYQGFTTYNDVTYPLVTQTVITDGQWWSFYVYQLNTTLLHSHHSTENPLCNLCWGTPRLKLFETFENGKFVGFNKNVLKHLVSFYINAPNVRNGVELKPYLGKEVKYIADISDDGKRVWLEKIFKHLVSNRPKHRLPYELYHWEKIYKVDHKTRPFDARRRPFELGVDPYKRRLDEHVGEYVPKKFRENKKRDKWAKTYYP